MDTETIMSADDSTASTYKDDCDCRDCRGIPSSSAETFLSPGEAEKEKLTEEKEVKSKMTVVYDRRRQRFCDLYYVKKDLLLGLALGILLSGLYVFWVLVGCPLLISALDTGGEVLPVTVTPPGSDHPGDPGHGTSPPAEEPDIIAPVVRYRGIYLGVLLGSTAQQDKTVTPNVYEQVEYFTSSSTPKLGAIKLNQSSTDSKEFQDSNRAMYLMLKHICEKHDTKYDWYVRVADDVIIRDTRLRKFLRELNPHDKHLLGHPTLPVQDETHRVLEGEDYCYGGPGLVISSGLMTDLCPVLSDCPWEERVPGDVVLASCSRRLLQVTCGDGFNHQELRELFFHSYRNNVMDLAEQFTSHPEALTLHPITLPVLRAHVIDTDLRHQIEQLQQRRQILLDKLEKLTITGDTNKKVVENRGDSFMVDGSLLSRDSCSEIMDKKEKSQIKEVISLANASSRVGSQLNCREFTGGWREIEEDQTLYTVDLLCDDPKSGSVVGNSVRLRQEHGAGETRVKEREVDMKLAVVVHGDNLETRHLIPVLQNLVDVMDEVFLTFLLVSDDPELSLLVSDLEDWCKRRGAELQALPDRKSLLRELDTNHPESMVLLLPAPVRIRDSGFMWRCLTIPQAGRQVYKPCADSSIAESSICNSSPACLYAEDVSSYYQRLSQVQHLLIQPTRHGRITIISAADHSIFYQSPLS